MPSHAATARQRCRIVAPVTRRRPPAGGHFPEFPPLHSLPRSTPTIHSPIHRTPTPHTPVHAPVLCRPTAAQLPVPPLSRTAAQLLAAAAAAPGPISRAAQPLNRLSAASQPPLSRLSAASQPLLSRLSAASQLPLSCSAAGGCGRGQSGGLRRERRGLLGQGGRRRAKVLAHLVGVLTVGVVLALDVVDPVEFAFAGRGF